jgi:hypothetical protein
MIRKLNRSSWNVASSWTNLQYDDEVYDSDEYWNWRNDRVFKKKPKGASFAHIDNAYLFVDYGDTRPCFMEAYNWCKEHSIRRVICGGYIAFAVYPMNDISIPVCLANGWKISYDSVRSASGIVRDAKETTNFTADEMSGISCVRLYKDKNDRQYARYWYSGKMAKNEYDNCMGWFITLNSLFDIDFDYTENAENGDRIFTVAQKQ